MALGALHRGKVFLLLVVKHTPGLRLKPAINRARNPFDQFARVQAVQQFGHLFRAKCAPVSAGLPNAPAPRRWRQCPARPE